jgi:glycosyltransferase involved in cell wall biosynthesis
MRPDPRRLGRIAYVCTDPGIPVFGSKGASIHVQEVLRALLRRGHRPELFTCRLGGSAPVGLEGVPIHLLPRAEASNTAERERRSRHLDWKLAEALRRRGPFDLIYQRYSLWSDSGMRFAAEEGVPGVLEVNAPLVDEQLRHRNLEDREGAQRVTRSAFRHASLLVAVSQVVADWVGNALDGVHERIQVVPNGVDAVRFQHRCSLPGPTSLRSEVDSAEDGRDSRPLTIGFVGTLKPWHGLPGLLQAFSLLSGEIRPRAEPAPYRLLIVGDGPERATLQRQARRQGLEPLVEVTGAVPHAEIPRLLRRMDVAVAPYPEPGPGGFYFSPLKVLEYMAAGRAVVASRLASIEALVTHGVHGLLTPPGDAFALADALKRLRTDPLLRRRLGENGRRRVLHHFTWDQVVDHILESALATPRSLPLWVRRGSPLGAAR